MSLGYDQGQTEGVSPRQSKISPHARDTRRLIASISPSRSQLRPAGQQPLLEGQRLSACRGRIALKDTGGTHKLLLDAFDVLYLSRSSAAAANQQRHDRMTVKLRGEAVDVRVGIAVR
eukprot:768163-Hanusia_phi.AAC.3